MHAPVERFESDLHHQGPQWLTGVGFEDRDGEEHRRPVARSRVVFGVGKGRDAAHRLAQGNRRHARQAAVLPRPGEQVGREIVILEQGIDDMALRVDQQHVLPAVGGMAPAEEHIMLAVRLLVAAAAGIVGGVLRVAVVQRLELAVGAGTAGCESGGKLLHGRDHGRGVAHADDVVAHPFEMIVNIFAARLGDRCQRAFGSVLQGTAGDQGDDRQQQRNGSDCR
ncbi:MAG: hypothetical protein AW09_000859 [Candidatus Accumulibacter phosphatis]|uniref:Uncharacterized protein n=1 Tax=Candidatus Accumulibacter phosphatis TaxID=327160 RepID=A0A080M0M0_9PROT|nr:MAG: hypothetical protein AW09_000859 [Candidatus Accumulibacter phosphatis]